MGVTDLLIDRPAATHAEASDAGHAGVWVYHRPGCPYCARMTWVLNRRAAQARWVDIWQDADAAAYVRSVNGGDETVPTVVVDGLPRTNPSPRAVRRALADPASWR